MQHLFRSSGRVLAPRPASKRHLGGVFAAINRVPGVHSQVCRQLLRPSRSSHNAGDGATTCATTKVRTNGRMLCYLVVQHAVSKQKVHESSAAGNEKSAKDIHNTAFEKRLKKELPSLLRASSFVFRCTSGLHFRITQESNDDKTKCFSYKSTKSNT